MKLKTIMNKKISSILSLTFILSLFCPAFAANEARTIEPTHHFVFDTIPLDLKEITNSADRIFAGVCTKAKEIENDPASNLRIVKYTFKITEGIKGVTKKSEITFNQWKPTTNDGGYLIGKKYVIFLYPSSSLGLTSPVGFLQGKFYVEKKGANRGVEYIRNKVNNRGLTRNLRTQKRILIKGDKYLNNYIHKCSEEGKPIRYKDFVRAVRYLISE